MVLIFIVSDCRSASVLKKCDEILCSTHSAISNKCTKGMNTYNMCDYHRCLATTESLFLKQKFDLPFFVNSALQMQISTEPHGI